MRNSTACHCVLTAFTAPRTQQLNGYAVQGPNRKLARGPEGDLCLERESRLSPGVRLQTKKGVCVFVCVCNSCEVVSFKTGKRHTHAFTHKHTHRRRHTGSIVAPSVCLWRCSLRVLVIATSTPKQKAGWLFSGPASSTHPIAHRYYTPLQLAVKLGPFTTLEASEDTKKCTHGGLGIAGCCVCRCQFVSGCVTVITV